jgi:8-oxo-dGTP pyrophosphatase MutT (NUDIX family)
MGFIDRIAECNNADLSRYVPFVLADGRRVGWIRRDRVELLAEHPDCLALADGCVRLRPDLRTFTARTKACAAVVDALVARGELGPHRGELYPVKERFEDEPELELDRAAVPWFGVRAWGVHVNGFVRRGGELGMWIAHRARGRINYPGMLDNIVAGGQPMGLTLRENMLKECEEEASLPAAIAERAVCVGSISYVAENEHGVKPDRMFCYDLELPSDVTPHPRDGEVERFELMPLGRVAGLVRDTREFKFNCNLVILQFLVRHGWLTAANEREYAAIMSGLTASIP